MTICDIAKSAGVSIATVSRVINNKGYVKEETRNRVEQVITDNDFSPNAVARSLIKRESSMIALIMPDRVNPFFSNVIDSIETKADESNLKVLFYNTLGEQEKEHKALQSVMEQQVKGLLIMPIIHSDHRSRELLEKMEESGIPVVLVDRDLAEGSFDAVFIDNKGAVYKATKALIMTGHRKIAVINSPEIMRGGNTRIDGYFKCLEENEIAQNADYICDSDFQQETAYLSCQKLMELSDPPTAVLATGSSATLGCIRYFNEHGIEIGKDIGLIGFDDIATLNIIGYSISVIDRPMREMGERAFTVLMERVESVKIKKRSREIILQTKLILRGSEECDKVKKSREE